MITAGIDVGSLSTKAVIVADGKPVGSGIVLTSPDTEASAANSMNKALQQSDLARNDILHVTGTGYGRINISFADKTTTEIACHAKGANAQNGLVRTILDMGGQDCKAIRCDEQGRVVNFVMNDKCAAGTGRFLERIADLIDCSLEELGPMSLQGVNKHLPISSTCAVFAEEDIRKLIRAGEDVNAILAGAFDSLAIRIQALIDRVGTEETLCFSGGVAKNVGIVTRLEKSLGLKIFIPIDPQIIGAFGAALIGWESMQ